MTVHFKIPPRRAQVCLLHATFSRKHTKNSKTKQTVHALAEHVAKQLSHQKSRWALEVDQAPLPEYVLVRAATLDVQERDGDDIHEADVGMGDAVLGITETLFHRDISHKIKQNTTSASYPKMLRRIKKAADAEAEEEQEDAPEPEAAGGQTPAESEEGDPSGESDEDKPPVPSGDDDLSEDEEVSSMSADPDQGSPATDPETDDRHKSIMAELEQPVP